MKITLKSARVNRGMLQSDISEKLGVYQETYSNWETGRKPMKQITKLAVASLLDMKGNEIEWPDETENEQKETLRT